MNEYNSAVAEFSQIRCCLRRSRICITRKNERVVHVPCAKCSALTRVPPLSISKNSESSRTAGSDRISRDFIRDIVNVVKNCIAVELSMNVP